MEASELFRQGFFMASGCLTSYAMFEIISDVTEMILWKLLGKRVDGFDEEEDEW